MASSKSTKSRCRVVKAPTPFEPLTSPSIFLSGSIDPPPLWQDTLTTSLSHLPVTILNPLRLDWDSSWREELSSPQFVQQVNWELDALERADVVVVHFGPLAKAPITLMELGLAARGQRVVVCCPEGYWKRGNVLVVCGRLGIPVVDTLEQLTQEVLGKLKEVGVDVPESGK
ncbi:hypothetical protein LSUE1_G005371 [Lachnellula suecica]|uniref:Uncharacterized protein n=1 Tax=Lachnellula suecica TaxID=602035 RepID=A0A8T9BYV3_9HELO|nr:hypothetical protein LSUE1_G005371 [Lachnellula suecica]